MAERRELERVDPMKARKRRWVLGEGYLFIHSEQVRMYKYPNGSAVTQVKVPTMNFDNESKYRLILEKIKDKS